jgi:hypothetical protein
MIRRAPQYQSEATQRRGLAWCAADSLLFNFDGVAPCHLFKLVALGREVGPGFRLVKCNRVVHAIPLDEGQMLGRWCPLYGNNPSSYGA